MTPLEKAKAYLGRRYVFHPAYRLEDNPWHSNIARVDLRATFERVRRQMAPSKGGQVVALRAMFREYHQGIGR